MYNLLNKKFDLDIKFNKNRRYIIGRKTKAHYNIR